MRKELKMIGSKDRHIFTAIFIRFGFRDGYKKSFPMIGGIKGKSQKNLRI